MRIHTNEPSAIHEGYQEPLERPSGTPAPPPPPPPAPSARSPEPFPPEKVQESRQQVGPGGMILPSRVTVDNPDYLLIQDLMGDPAAAREYWNALTSGSNPAQVAAAKRSLSEYLSKNPNADPASRQLAREAALLQAHFDELKDSSSGAISKDSLAAYAKSHSGPLAEAAKLFSSDGMMDMLDRAGENAILNKADGRAGASNIDSWLRNSAPKDVKGFAEAYQRAQFINARSAASHGSNLNDDLRKKIAAGTYTLDPSASTAEKEAHAANKAAAFYELVELSQMYHQKGQKVPDDLQKAIDRLSADQGLQTHLTQSMASTKDKMGGPSSKLNQAARDALSNFANEGLKKTIEGAQGGPIGDRLLAWLKENGSTVGLARELSEGTLKLSPELQTRVDDAFKKEILELDLSKPEVLEKLGKTPQERQRNYLQKVAAFASVHKLSEDESKTIKSNSLALMQPLQDVDVEKLVSAWQTNGQFDHAKAEALVNSLQKTHPDLFGKDATTADVVKALKGIDDLLRKGADVPGKVAKWNTDLIDPATNKFKPGAFSSIMSQIKDSPTTKFLTGGALHVVSGILGGIGLALSSPKPTDFLTGIASVSTFLEGVGKIGAGQVTDDLAKAKWDNAAKFFKGLGASANMLLGPISLVDGIRAVQNGDASGWLSIAGGAVGTVAAGAAIADVLGMGAGFAVLDAALGAVGGVIAVVALFYMLFKSLGDQAKEDRAFRNEAGPIMNKYGLNDDPVEEELPERNSGPNRRPAIE